MEEILNKLNINQEFSKVILGDVDIPYNHDEYNNVKDYWYSHPPSLIPIFLGNRAFYYGILKHFFIDRKLTFVEFSLESGFFSEKLRSDLQFITKLILEMIMIKEDLTSSIIDFAKKVSFSEYNKVFEFAEKYGDNPEDFDKLIFFEKDLPLYYCKNLNLYNGDFPSSPSILNNSMLHKCCSYEIANENLLNSSQLPKWLDKNANKIELFNIYLQENDLSSAWLTLNSSGWLLKDVVKSLEILNTMTSDNLFHLVSNNWINGWKNSSFIDGNY